VHNVLIVDWERFGKPESIEELQKATRAAALAASSPAPASKTKSLKPAKG
jgi:hypothetical protein